MADTTLRLPRPIHEQLDAIASRRRVSMSALLETLADQADAEDLLAAANTHFTERQREHAETVDAWDRVADDGLRHP